MLKYLAKFASDILPSVAATIIGAYIVNHYITAKPDAPAPAAMSVPAANNKPADTRTKVANIPGFIMGNKNLCEDLQSTQEDTIAQDLFDFSFRESCFHSLENFLLESFFDVFSH